MAERRMFAKSIIDSDEFLDMPLSAQALYFHLSMRADDDGFVDKPKAILRTVGGRDDDLKLLFAKQFLIPFENGIVVIRHWKIHNYIRKDRYSETKHLDEKARLSTDSSGKYELFPKSDEKSMVYQLATKWQPSDNQVTTNGCQMVDPGKVRLELGKDNPPYSPPAGEGGGRDVQAACFAEFWKQYPKKVGKGAAEKAWRKIAPDKELLGMILSALADVKQSAQWRKDNGQFIPNPATWLNQRRWEDEGVCLPEQETTEAGTPIAYTKEWD